MPCSVRSMSHLWGESFCAVSPEYELKFPMASSRLWTTVPELKDPDHLHCGGAVPEPYSAEGLRKV
jgi:hypothetical protein